MGIWDDPVGIWDYTWEPSSPEYNRAQNRRQNRIGINDHDIYEGIPVRHWRRDYVTVLPPPEQDTNASSNNIWASELPKNISMPKDQSLLPQHSAELLRAARSGKIYKRPSPVEEEEADADVIGDKPEKKDNEVKDKGFGVKAWKQIPRHLEGPDLDYLAKRRKGLITISSKPAQAGPTITKAKVKRIDAAGHEYVENVTIHPGQKVEGEVISQTTVPNPAAAPADFAPVPTPPRRIPKRKLKGPGRGRKKQKIEPAPTSAPLVTEGNIIGQPPSPLEAVDGVKQERESRSTHAPEDMEILDSSIHDSSSDEEGEEHEAPESTQPSSPVKPNLDAPPVPISYISTSGMDQFGPPLLQTQPPDAKEVQGSPLKIVALATSALTSPIDGQGVPSSNSAIIFQSSAENNVVNAANDDTTAVEEEMREEVTGTAPTELPLPPPSLTDIEVEASKDVLEDEKQEEEMLLDIIDKDHDHAATVSEPLSAVIEAPGVEAPANKQEEQSVEDDDDFPDLLGGLEKQLE
ncbi:hypothetical protein BJ878DRAFT_567082 [Calycina marina]|uniref:Lyr family protein n=1 Tax=Calycina marina TaxID=1763456 RepID=A0A9P7Z3M0_9HELO|nr:hypothetical protein BJ878DRAFT_567082 [Calycina marina]